MRKDRSKWLRSKQETWSAGKRFGVDLSFLYEALSLFSAPEIEELWFRFTGTVNTDGSNQFTGQDQCRVFDEIKLRDKGGDLAVVVLNGMGLPYDANDANVSFHWVYVVSNTPNATSGTYNTAQALSGTNSEGVADVYGPFNTEAQALAAATDVNLFSSTRYRGWSGPDAFPSPGRISAVRFGEGDFLQLGIPTVL